MVNPNFQQQDDVSVLDLNHNTGEVIIGNPFPGLRPFDIDDSHLFFGRENQVEEVLFKLASNRFVTIMGYSGSGKSSLISCGVIPTLYGGFITEISPDWNIVVARPGNSPINQLAGALHKSLEEPDADIRESRIRKRVIGSILRSDPNGLNIILKDVYAVNNQNILIYIDQFEELIRFSQSDERAANEARLYVNFILDACRRSDLPVFVAITMRSDYVGECSKFPGLTQFINESNYLIPQMNRDQKRMAIEGLVAVGGGILSKRLLKRLINDLGDDQDQLPILQHSLMRTWDYWIKNREDGEPMDIGHYNAIGRISEALSQHANEIYDGLEPRQREITEILFKSLTEKSSGNYGIRKPAKLGFIAELAECSEEEVIEVIEQFRAPGRSFLMPVSSVPLDGNTLVEISHESLMRIWTRLKVWVEEEYESAQMYRRLSEASEMYQIGRTGLWRPPDLQLALNWQKKQKPTRAWARRYDEAFERTIVFLDTSRITYEAEQRNQEIVQKRLLKRTKAVAVILGIAAIISILFFVFALTQSNEAKRQAQIAQDEKTEAQKQRDKANEAQLKAQEQTKKAQQALIQVQEQKQLAEEALEKAKFERSRAEANYLIAQQQTEIANNQKVVAQKASERVRSEFIRAEKNFKDAQRLLYLSIAQSLSVKSLTVEDDNIQGALAQQAKMFFDEFDGRHYDPYIYNGLYSAMVNYKGEDYNTLKGLHRNSIRNIAFKHSSNEFYSTGTQGKVVKTSLDNSLVNEVILTNRFPNRVLKINDNDTYLATATDSSFIQITTLATGKVSKIQGHKGFVNDLHFDETDHNTFFSVGVDKTIRENNANTLTSKKFMSTTHELKHIDVYNNQLIGATIEGKLVRINLNDKTETILYSQDNIPIQSVAFSKDGGLLAFGDENGVVRVMNVRTEAILYELSGHKRRVSTIAFSPDNKLLATGSFDGVIQMWPVKELSELPIRITDNDAYVWDLEFSTDSENIIAACSDGEIRVWPTNPDKFSNQMCNFMEENLSKEQWETYVGDDINYRNTCLNLVVEDY